MSPPPPCGWVGHPPSPFVGGRNCVWSHALKASHLGVGCRHPCCICMATPWPGEATFDNRNNINNCFIAPANERSRARSTLKSLHSSSWICTWPQPSAARSQPVPATAVPATTAITPASQAKPKPRPQPRPSQPPPPSPQPAKQNLTWGGRGGRPPTADDTYILERTGMYLAALQGTCSGI